MWIRYADCVLCRGRGWLIGGDDAYQCPKCRLRLQREKDRKNPDLEGRRHGKW